MKHDESQQAVPRFPLAWPDGWMRTPRTDRIKASFRTKGSNVLSMRVATQRLEENLDKMGAQRVTLSTDVELRMDGSPRSDREPDEPGAAIYFSYKGRAITMACDKWTRVADNVNALSAHIDALRRIERYGVGSLEQALAGYKALPADSAADWRQVFGFGKDAAVTPKQLRDAYRRLAVERHPDKHQGNGDAMYHLNRAKEFADIALGIKEQA